MTSGHCACGNAATKKKHSEFVCDRCAKLEHGYEKAEVWANRPYNSKDLRPSPSHEELAYHVSRKVNKGAAIVNRMILDGGL